LAQALRSRQVLRIASRMAGMGDFKVVSVKIASTIKDLCVANGIMFSHGCGYYKLAKKERISSKKVLVACKKGKTASLVCGTKEVRNLLGLGSGNIQVAPKDVKSEWALYVQSTSHNRKLEAGTEVLLRGGRTAAASAKKVAKRPASDKPQLPAAKHAKTEVQFPIKWNDFPGRGDEGYIKAKHKQLYVDNEVFMGLPKNKFNTTLAELSSAAKAVKWQVEGSACWVAPGGFRIQACTADSYEKMEAEEYIIALQVPQHALVVGNIGSHPFVELEWMWFGNSDGSTYTRLSKAAMKSPEALLRKAMTDAKAFVFKQQH